MNHIAREQIDLADETRGTNFVLVLEVGTVAPFEHEDLHAVLACYEKIIDGNLGGHVRHLAICRKFAVDVKIEAGINSLKHHINFLACQNVTVNLEGALVKTARVIDGHVRRIYGNGIIDVDIVGCIISAVERILPAHGNGQAVTLTEFPFGIQEIGHLMERIKIAEAPLAAKRIEIFGICAVVGVCRSLVLIRNEICARSLATDVQIFG